VRPGTDAIAMPLSARRYTARSNRGISTTAGSGGPATPSSGLATPQTIRRAPSVSEERASTLHGVATIEAMVLAVLVQIDVVRGVGGDGGVDTA
jgi:hypothetical protein